MSIIKSRKTLLNYSHLLTTKMEISLRTKWVGSLWLEENAKKKLVISLILYSSFYLRHYLDLIFKSFLYLGVKWTLSSLRSISYSFIYTYLYIKRILYSYSYAIVLDPPLKSILLLCTTLCDRVITRNICHGLCYDIWYLIIITFWKIL